MGVPVVAVLDANVLHPVAVCDCLMWIALEGVLRAHWTEEIHEEWMRSLLERRPDLARSALERRRHAMEPALPGALITGHYRHIDGLELPDPDDRHVLAAAIEAGASHIITYNVSDFPNHHVVRHGIQAYIRTSFSPAYSGLSPGLSYVQYASNKPSSGIRP